MPDEDVTMLIQAVGDDLPILAVTDEGLGNTSWVLGLGDEAVVVESAGRPGVAILDGGPDDWAREADQALERS